MGVVKTLKHKHEKILGIDASTNSLAFCYMKNSSPVRWGELQYSHSTNLFERLGSIEQRAGIIVDMFPDLDYVVIEAPVKVMNMRVAIHLAYSYGIVAAKFAARGIEVTDVPPVVWQKYIGNFPFTKAEKLNLRSDFPGKSKSWYSTRERAIRKQRTIDWVKEEFNITILSNNVTDAFGVCWHAGKGKG